MKARQYRKSVQRRMKADHHIRYPWQSYVRRTFTAFAHAMGVTAKEVSSALRSASFKIPRNEYIDPRVIAKDRT